MFHTTADFHLQLIKMYKAIDRITGQEIIILAPEWRMQLSLLKIWGSQDRLICQGCRQPLRVRAGRYRRRHFAHKHLRACSLGFESPEILNARAVLYERLVQVFPQGVTLEKVLDGSGLPRPVDGWVETDSKILAYWIIDAGIKQEPRQAVLDAITNLPVKVNWVFTANLLREDSRKPGSLHLTPTERAFLVRSDYDGPYEGDLFTQKGCSLHYLDAESEILITYRGLRVIHLPQWYQGHKQQSSFSEVSFSPVTGEFIHPGENEAASRYRIARNRKEKIRQEAEERLAVWQEHRQLKDPVTKAPLHANEEFSDITGFDRRQPAVCIYCRQITTDWWSLLPIESEHPAMRRCKCRECLMQGLS